MMLMTKEIEKKIPAIGTHSDTIAQDVPIIAKFFAPWSNWTWYVTEGTKDGDDWRFFGMVHGDEKELGSFMLSELENVNGPIGLKIERDRGYTGTLSEVL